MENALLKDNKQESSNKYRSCMTSWLGTIELCIVFSIQVISSLAVLVMYSNDCQKPIR